VNDVIYEAHFSIIEPNNKTFKKVLKDKVVPELNYLSNTP
jgi:hypothetical protein